jgi:DNA-binding transcriptional LysR family regulator
MDLSFTKLRHLATVAEQRSFSRAAEVLGISQPALSRSISSIEERYGLRIFERGRAGTDPTAAGAPMIEQVLALLRNVEDLDKNLMLYGKGEFGSLAFGISSQISDYFIKKIASEIINVYPNVDINLIIRSAPELADQLSSNKIEFFICIDSIVINNQNIDTEHIGDTETVYCVRPSHPLSKNKSLMREDLAPYSFASPAKIHRTSPDQLNIALVCDNFHVLQVAVEESDMIMACTRQFVINRVAEGKLKILEIMDRPLMPRPTFIARKRGRELSPLAYRVIALARSSLAQGVLESRSSAEGRKAAE